MVVAHTLSRKRTSEFAPASLPARHCCLITYSTLPWEFRPASTRCSQRFRGCTDTALPFCLLVLVVLTFVNLRGVRESGMTFAFPVIGFVACVGSVIAVGLIRAWLSGGDPQPAQPPPPVPNATETMSAWILLRSFASGCTAMTGVDAVSNGVPLFRKPEVPRAQWTLTIIVAVLGAFLLAISYLSPPTRFTRWTSSSPVTKRSFRNL